ncbi:MAG: prepilin-type N-terminal cleavage/methylation domain-containing protein [Pseudomonadota bacterium]|nr:prepilin-type N-terminal cleavage/methylation domain-containing protein [Pseudomonadota bacterium]
MSGSCPRADGSPAGPAGFSLLELLIVLALVSMMAAMVAPRLQRTYDAIVRSGDRAEAIRQVERLPLVARDGGRAIEIAAEDPGALARLLALPQGWRMQALEPLRIEASGLCHAGRIQVQVDGTSENWTLSAPDCGVDDAS